MAESDYVNLSITTNVNENVVNRRYSKQLTIAEFKSKLELITGASPAAMKLELYGKDDKLKCRVEDDSATLDSLQIDEGFRVHVIDPTKKAGEFEDSSASTKYMMEEEEYLKRPDTVRAFLEKNKLGKFSEEEMKKKEEEKQKQMEEDMEKAKTISVGNRCETRVPGQPRRRGTVMFVGEVHFKPSWWIGIKYDEPMGKNDGSVGGHRYFECQPKYGGFVKPCDVVVGDFPEESIADDDVDEI